ncbi:MAG: 30S ribosome-binding factor RbfA [Patescibacteria group bacterium]|jgi:ribosome-binding factor A
MPKIDELIKREVAIEIYRRFAGKIITVTSVKVSPDLYSARIWISGIGNLDDLARTVQSEASEMREAIASRITIRKMPRLNFCADHTVEKVDRIDKLIQEIHDDDKTSRINNA